MANSVFRRMAATVVLLALLTTGCAGSAPQNELNPDSPTDVEIWHYYNGPQKLAFDRLVAEFNETVGQEKGIVVEAFSQGNVNELAGKVRDAAAKKVGADTLPNVFATYSDDAFMLDQQGLLAPLDSYLTDEERDQYVHAFLDEGRFDEAKSLKIFPIAKSLEIMIINQTDWAPFAAATGADWKSLTTMESVTAAARDYYQWSDEQTPAPNDGHALFGRDAMANYMLVGYRQITGRDLLTQGEMPSQSIEKQAVRRLWDNYYVPFINGWFDAVGRFRSDDVKTGDLIALVGSTSGALYFPDQVTVSDTVSYPIVADVLPAPIFEGCENYAVQQGAGMAVVKGEPKTEQAAVVFLKWFTEPVRNASFSASSGYLPVRKDADDIEMIRAAFTGENAMPERLDKMFASSLETMKNAKLYVTPTFSGTSRVRGVLENAMADRAVADRDRVNALVEGGMTRAEAAKKINTDQNFDDWYAGLLAQLDVAVA